MTDWLKRRRECKRCLGPGGFDGYIEGGFPGHRWVVPCECQPRTETEWAEAAEQERAATAIKPT